MRDENTLGGYLDKHERPPAFEGKNGRAYSVSIIQSEQPESDGFGAALMFVLWSEAGDTPVGHVETDYLVFADTPDEANAKICELRLLDVKKHLDVAIESRQKRSEW